MNDTNTASHDDDNDDILVLISSMADLLTYAISQLAVMVNGLPGAMGKEVAAACLRR